jgi:hypothetical protein
MGLDLWFREDVARILASTHETMRAAMGATVPLDVESAETYQQGFADALKAVAVAFGVAVPGEPRLPRLTRALPIVDAGQRRRGNGEDGWVHQNGGGP